MKAFLKGEDVFSDLPNRLKLARVKWWQTVGSSNPIPEWSEIASSLTSQRVLYHNPSGASG